MKKGLWPRLPITTGTSVYSKSEATTAVPRSDQHFHRYATASPGMIWVDPYTQTGWCLYDPFRPHAAPNITFLSSACLWRDDALEVSLLRLSASQDFFCAGLLELFDGGVRDRPQALQLAPSSILHDKNQSLLVLFASAHPRAGYASTVRAKLEFFLDTSTPKLERRFDLRQIHLRCQNYLPIDPNYLFALIADMNNLLAHLWGWSRCNGCQRPTGLY